MKENKFRELTAEEKEIKSKIYVGIDPDVSKSGVAIWDVLKKNLELDNLKFFDLFQNLVYLKNSYGERVVVIIEAGWLNKSNWHAVKGGNSSINAQIGQRTGANHEVGKKIVEMCEYFEIEHELIKPTRSKVDAKMFAKITGVIGRTNQEQRDAGMLVFGRK